MAGDKPRFNTKGKRVKKKAQGRVSTMSEALPDKIVVGAGSDRQKTAKEKRKMLRNTFNNRKKKGGLRR